MTHSKFVKGPYEDNGAGLIYGQVSGDDDEAPFVADCCNNPGSGEYTEQEQATGRLLAASWEMLAALESLVCSLDPRKLRQMAKASGFSVDHHLAARRQAIAVIRKAGGAS